MRTTGRLRGARTSVVVVGMVSAALVVLGGAAVARTTAAKVTFSDTVTDYIPAKIAGADVVIDPRSAGAGEGGGASCAIPPEGATIVPLVKDPATDYLQDAFGGVWDCAAGAPSGTGFVIGIEASELPDTTPKLSVASLAADGEPEAKPTTVKVGGKKIKAFTYTLADVKVANGQALTFAVVTAEPRPHLLVGAAVPDGEDPVPALVVMLKAGAGKAPRLIE